MLGIISNHRDYTALKGVVERLVAALGAKAALEAEAADEPLLDPAPPAGCDWMARCWPMSARCGPRHSGISRSAEPPSRPLRSG